MFFRRSRKARRADKVRDQASLVLGRVAPTVELAKDEVTHAAEVAQDWARPRVEAAVVWATPHVGSARSWAGPRLEQTWDRSLEVAAPIAEKVAPRVDAARDHVVEDLLPRVIEAMTTAAAAGAAAGETARERGVDAVAVLRGDAVAVRPKPRRRWRKLLLLLAVLLAAGGAGFAALRRNQPVEDDPWAPMPPTSTPAPTSSQAGSGHIQPVTSSADVTGGLSSAGGQASTRLSDADQPAGSGPSDSVGDGAAESALDAAQPGDDQNRPQGG